MSLELAGSKRLPLIQKTGLPENKVVRLNVVVPPAVLSPIPLLASLPQLPLETRRRHPRR